MPATFVKVSSTVNTCTYKKPFLFWLKSNANRFVRVLSMINAYSWWKMDCLVLSFQLIVAWWCWMAIYSELSNNSGGTNISVGWHIAGKFSTCRPQSKCRMAHCQKSDKSAGWKICVEWIFSSNTFTQAVIMKRGLFHIYKHDYVYNLFNRKYKHIHFCD